MMLEFQTVGFGGFVAGTYLDSGEEHWRTNRADSSGSCNFCLGMILLENGVFQKRPAAPELCVD